jgi:TonB family protein
MSKLATLLFTATLSLANAAEPQPAPQQAPAPVKTPAPMTSNYIYDVTDKPPCSTKMTSAADPDAYYPAAAKAEDRQGAPIIRVTVKQDKTTADSIELVTSSSHADLDEAALRVAKASRYATTCEEGTIMFKVKFTVRQEPPK